MANDNHQGLKIVMIVLTPLHVEHLVIQKTNKLNRDKVSFSA